MVKHDEHHEFRKFVRRWTITVVYIAIVLTGILALRIYDTFFGG